MACIATGLAGMCPEIESQLKPWLMFAGGYLPQTWVFITEEESASIRVESDGSCKSFKGPFPEGDRDVTVEVSHAQLSAALKTRDKAKVPRGPAPKVTFHTSKGQTAWNLLKGRFGL